MQSSRVSACFVAAVFLVSVAIVGCGGGGAQVGTSGTTTGGGNSSGGTTGSTSGGGSSGGAEQFLVWIRDGQLYGMSLVGDWATNPKLPIQKSPSSHCRSPFIVSGGASPKLLWVESASQSHSTIKELSIDANGSATERTVVDDGFRAIDPSGSADGAIVYASNASGAFQVYIAGSSQPLTAIDPQDPGHDGSWGPEISGDGKTILFSRRYWDDHSMDWKAYNVLCSMSRDGSGFDKLIGTTEGGRWNANTSKVTFEQGDRAHPGSNHYLFVADADGSNRQQLSNIPGGGDKSPCFSPDGDYVFYSWGGDIVALNLANLQTIQITNGPESDSEPHCGSFQFPK